MKFRIKETYLLFLIVVGLVSLALYSTYALFTASTELTDVVDFTATLSTNNSIAEYEMITVPAGETKIIELNVTNSYQGTLNYLTWYEMINPSTTNENISVGLYTEQNNTPGSGSIATGGTINLLVGIANDTDSEIIVNIGVAGSADENMNLSGNKLSLPSGWNPNDGISAYRTLKKLALTGTEKLKADTPSFGTTSCSEGCGEATVGIYQAEDDLGTSYYFRGDIDYNYVKFGKNTAGNDMYWRIIRINGDGSIRMIYDGTSARENGTALSDENIVEKAFNTADTDNAHVGYMYGVTELTEEISNPMCLKLDENSNVVDTYATNSTKETCESAEGEWATTAYEATHANVKDSVIKDFLENTWYTNNILNSEYEQYIVNAIYCNDRSISISYNGNGAYTNKGFGTEPTVYRAMGDRFDNNNNTFLPSFKCPNINDSFTLKNDDEDIIGNNKLLYPVGLLTIDDAVFAGMYITDNTKAYLRTGIYYWTMTPAYFKKNDNVKSIFGVIRSGGSFTNSTADASYSVLPVISISADAIKSGTGDRLSPFSTEESTS